MELKPLGAPHRDGRLAVFWELLFPDRCLGCGRRGVTLCPPCGETIPWLPASVCPRCARPSTGGRRCRRCDAPRLSSVRATCTFEGVIRTAIHRLKFRHAGYLARLLAEVIAVDMVRRPLEAEVVIPVPLSSSRRRERGYNQAELIAAELARLALLPAPSPGILSRLRETRPQVGLAAIERRRNLRGAFACQDGTAVAGRRCLLVDDVMTTGATLEACAEPLLLAGAKRVMALVVAREV